MRPLRAWMIIRPNGDPAFITFGGAPELFGTRTFAESQNIDRLNGSKVIRVELREVRTNRRRRKR